MYRDQDDQYFIDLAAALYGYKLTKKDLSAYEHAYIKRVRRAFTKRGDQRCGFLEKLIRSKGGRAILRSAPAERTTAENQRELFRDYRMAQANDRS